jgi:uncharacterized membrane protein
MFDRLWEILLGLDKGFLSRQGDLSLQFNPDWPLQHFFAPVGGASFLNLILILLGVLLVVYVYRREGKSTFVRSCLAGVRLLLLLLILAYLNRPVLVLDQTRKEPSVVAVLMDDTLSMSVPDVPVDHGQPISRMEAAQNLLTGSGNQLLNELAKVHNIKIYRFGRDAQQVAEIDKPDDVLAAAQHVQDVKPTEDGTQVVQSVTTVVEDLQGQRLAGVVLLTDGKDVPVRERPESINELHAKFPVGIYAVPIGQDALPKTVEVLKPDYEPSAFLDDYTVVKFSVRGSGFEPNHKLKVTLKTKKDGKTVLDEKGNPVTAEVTLADDRPQPVELSFMPALAMGMDPRRLPAVLPPEDRALDLVVEADKQPGQINPTDNVRDVSIQVLDTQIRVLFVDGYPRWEYRYVKNTLVRDKTMKVNCLLTSADPSFVQEATDGITPIRAFPESLDQLLQYDVVLFGDVDQHEFSDAQLQLINDFVSKRGGGFGLIAGTRYSPQSYKNTPIQPVLPVDISRTEADDSDVPITEGFHPSLTAEGLASSIFRFYADKDQNKKYVEQLSPPLFWYCHGIVARPQSTVLLEHPIDLTPGSPRKAPLLVVSQYGAGRTLFSAIDDSWRWRFYTGEYIFDAYWVQQIRYLARNRKLDERNVTFEPTQSEYQLGTQAALDMNVLNPKMSLQLPPQIPVEILDANGKPVKQVTMTRIENSTKYSVSWTADSLGRFVARLPPLGDGPSMDRPFAVKSPQLELESPKLDRSLLAGLGRMVELNTAATELPSLIRSAARAIPVQLSRPIWDAPLALVLFVALITGEWVLRKLHGML